MSSSHVARHPHRGGGFSLIELTVVMVIAAIMAVVAVPTLTSLAATRSASAARLVVRDLSYARERAIASGLQTWVVFNTGSSSYSILQEPAGNPGRANAAAIRDPARQGNYSQAFGSGEFSGVSISAVNFDGGVECGFDWLGKPLNSGQTSLAASGTVTLSGGKVITVQMGTGVASTP
jgi:prepilin-type N-terminal cleavage/methylation domain-containing protein